MCDVVLTLSGMELGDEDSDDLQIDSTDKEACSEPCMSLTSLKPAIWKGKIEQPL